MTFYRSHTYPALTGAAVAQQDGVGAFFDDDAIVESGGTNTSTSEVVYEDAGLNGVVGGSDCTPLRGLTVTTASAAGAYNTSQITAVVEEVSASGVVTEKTLTATLTNGDGGETLDFVNAVSGQDASFTRVVSITVPAMADTDGTIEFGVGDIYARANEKFQWIMGLGTGNVKVQYPGGIVDVIITAAGREHTVTPKRVYRSGTTAIFSVGA